MAKSKIQRDPLPKEFKTIEEAAEFWDTHSLADYEDVQKDVEFEVAGQRGGYFITNTADVVVQLGVGVQAVFVVNEFMDLAPQLNLLR